MTESYSLENLENELSVINFENMDSTAEVKLAAEIGQILLERNKALENALENNQQLIAEQQAEIDKLVKQSQYLQNANQSSLQISVQMEQALIDLEQSNQKLIKQRCIDQDVLKDLKKRKEFLEQRCENLEESYEYIKERLAKAQRKMNVSQENLVTTSTDSVNGSVIEQVLQFANKADGKLIMQVEHLTSDLSDTKCEIAQYHGRMEKLENQLTFLLHKNMELEDMIASRRFPSKSRTTTSGCSSDRHKISTSLAEEIEAVKMSKSLESFADGCLITSTPPKVSKKSIIRENKTDDTILCMTDASDDLLDSVSSAGKKYRDQRNKLRRQAYLKKQLDAVASLEKTEPLEYKVRINVCIKIEPDENRLQFAICRQHRLRYFARTIVLAYKDTVMKGLRKILKPIISHPSNYLGTLILWSNKKFIERNIRVM